MTFGFVITDLVSSEEKFGVAGRFGLWEFEQNPWYKEILPKLTEGHIGNTYSAFNEAVTPSISDADYATAVDDLRDICLLRSFLRSMCITPSGSAQYSFAQNLTMGDSFVPPRAIRGFPEMKPSNLMAPFLAKGLPALSGQNHRWLRLLMFHWISSLSSHTLEDLFLAYAFSLILSNNLSESLHQIRILNMPKQCAMRADA